MITFYKVNGVLCFSERADLDFVKVDAPYGA